MKITVDGEQYESLMLAYQVTEIARLNEVLQRNGLSNAALRQRICAEFADANGTFLDQGWLQADAGSERYWPELLFSKRTLDPEEGLGNMEEVLVPEYASNFHECVSGNIHYYFEEQKQALGDIGVGRP
jgi:hypothetical protein